MKNKDRYILLGIYVFSTFKNNKKAINIEVVYEISDYGYSLQDNSSEKMKKIRRYENPI